METTRIIEMYLDGTLGQEETKMLEKRMSFDQDYYHLINFYKEVNESIRDKELMAVNDSIKKAGNAYFETEKPVSTDYGYRFLRNYFVRIAAIVIIILSVGIIIKYAIFNTTNTEKLFQKYYQTYETDIISRSTQSDIPTLAKAIISYSQEDYEGAIMNLDNIIEQDQKNYLAWFFRGLSYIETDEATEAISSFRHIPDSWNSPYLEHRDWYLALALLLNGNTDEAAGIFNHISISNGYYSERARKINKKLKP